MKATGIVRHVDDLGRIVIPKELGRTMGIKEGTPMEIFLGSEGEIIFKPYFNIGTLKQNTEKLKEMIEETLGEDSDERKSLLKNLAEMENIINKLK